MNHLKYELSVKVANLIQAQKYRCWYNARDALVHLPGMFLCAWYVEGWLVVPKDEEVQVVEHGWIECEDGRIVDPSIVLLEAKEQDMDYFPGLRCGWSQMQEIPQDVCLPLAHLVSHRKDGLGHPEYKTAYDAAVAHAEQLAQVSGKPVQMYPGETFITVMSEKGAIVIIMKG